MASVMTRYHDPPRVKRAVNLSNALADYRCGEAGTRKIVPHWTRRENSHLALLLRDAANAHLAYSLAEEKQRRLSQLLREITNRRILNDQKSLANAQLTLAGARPPLQHATARLVEDNRIIRLRRSDGTTTLTPDETADAFLDNLIIIMEAPEAIYCTASLV